MVISTFVEWMHVMETQYGPKTAFRYREHTGLREVTYTRYTADIRRYINYLEKKVPNVQGKHVGILARNSYQYAVCLFGTIAAGAVAVPLNVEESWDNIQYEIEFSDICCLFHDGEYQQKEWKLSEKYHHLLQDIEAFENADAEFDTEREGGPAGFPDRERPVLLLFTSGTTGRSKGVLLSEKNCFAPMSYFLKVVQANNGSEPRVFFMIPMYHISGLSGILTWTCLGCCLNLCNSMKHVYRDLAAMPSDHVSVVPMVLKMWYKDICRGKKERLGELKFITCGGAAVDAEIFKTFQQAGIQVQQGYGLTEVFGGGSTNSSPDPSKSASVGKPSPTCQFKFDDGEICIKSDSIMLGYYHDPEATAAAIRDGWLYTGDLGYFDEDGFCI
ncbi:MAG: long-chain fatty acid--CoA ligase [Clostridiales bacterium]|nr:long-chain fatty acid--CoA ligase [Clostridiales bacterium]